MSQSTSVTLTRRLILSVAAVLLWMMLVTGVFSLVTESTAIGIFWLGLGLALFVALIQGEMMSRLDGRKLPLMSIAIVLVVLLLIGITEVINLLMTEPKLTVSYLFDAAFSLGILILGGYSGYLLLRAPRSQSLKSKDSDQSN